MADAAVLAVIKKLVKQLAEATADFAKGGRLDLVSKNSEEINILQSYLPPELNEAEAEELVRQAVVEAQGAGLAGFGPVMGAVMKKVGGKIEGSRAKSIVTKILE